MMRAVGGKGGDSNVVQVVKPSRWRYSCLPSRPLLTKSAFRPARSLAQLGRVKHQHLTHGSVVHTGLKK